MKQYVNPLPTGGVPIFSENVNDALQKEIMDAVQAVASAVADGQALIVSGCVFANIGGSNYSMSAGIVLLDGVLMRIDAVASTTLTKYIAAGTPTVVTAVFEDGGTKNLTTETKATLLGAPPGSGQYITITSVNFAAPPKLIMSLDDNWVSTDITTAQLENQAGVAPTSVSSGKVRYRRTPKEVFVDIYFDAATFAATPTSIKVTIPAALYTLITADPMFLGALDMVGFTGQVHTTTIIADVGFAGSPKLSILPVTAWSSGTGICFALQATIKL